MASRILKSIFLGIIILFLGVNIISAAEISYCCEKTNSGAWCQNAPAQNCDSNYRSVPTSCEATSYCKLGCCYDSQEGTCMENTPQKVCDDSGGVWGESAECEISQCELGCCLIGDQAAFVTQTRCKKLASIYGLNIDFRTDITNEYECIANAFPDVKGACVIEEEFEKNCEFTTRENCLEIESSYGGNSSVEFHEGYLCSAEELGTNCGPTEKTICIEESDEVYFVDSCGNLANIYDSSKINDKNYWAEIYTKSESCNYDSGNAGSSGCGNCDYYRGSICGEYDRGNDRVRPTYGDNICKDLSCDYKGKSYEHGETWCADSSQGNEGISEIDIDENKNTDSSSENLPGSRYFRMLCYNGEVIVEPCADYRQEVCVESNVNGFQTAACKVNEWQDCIAQTTQKDCQNTDKRDCQWISTSSGTMCVPKYSPGFNFWEEGGDAKDICSTGNTQCIVSFEKNKGLLGIGEGGEECIDNCECLTTVWENQMRNVCNSLGDCGGTANYIGIPGYNSNGGVTIYAYNEDEA